MSAEDIAQYEFLKRMWKLKGVIGVMCVLLGVVIKSTIQVYDFKNSLATKEDLVKIVQPLADRVTTIEKQPRIKGFTQTKINGLITFNPVY